MRRPLDAELELRQRRLPLLLRARGLQQLDLQLDGGERCAQLVRRVGRELALRCERLRKPFQQVVERSDEGSDLRREIAGRQRLERGRAAAGDRAGDALERREPAAHAEPDDQREGREQREQRQQNALRDRADHLAAERHRMGDLDHSPVLQRRVNTPILPFPAHVAEAGAHRTRKVRARARVMEERARAVPDLGDEVGAVVVIIPRIERVSGRAEGLVAEREGELLQLVVEQLVHVVARFEKARAERCHGRDGERGDAARREAAGGSRSRLVADHVADAADVADQFGAELAPQIVDVHLDRVALDLFAPAVEALFELSAR